MLTIDSYVVNSRINTASPGARRRMLLLAFAGLGGLAIVAGMVFSGHAGTPSRPKYEARVEADAKPYPIDQGDEQIAAFQQSVAISHLTTIAPAPVETARAAPIAAKPPRVQKSALAVARKPVTTPAPPPRPSAAPLEVTVAEKAPVAVAPARKPPVLIEVVQRIEHAPDRVLDFATGVTAKVWSLRTKVGL